jgi:diguanylate cyclase (GGDEF)-like protein
VPKKVLCESCPEKAKATAQHAHVVAEYEKIIEKQANTIAEYERIIERNEKEKIDLKELANTDALTGLLNRRSLNSFLDRIIDHARGGDRAISLAMFDVDHFKKINDSYGHEVGDLVLHSIGKKLLESFRPGDIIARYGGEEFVIVFLDTNIEQASSYAERLRKTISELIIPTRKHGKISVTVSIGVTEVADEIAQSFLSRADEAMYVAKANGRNCVVAK